MKEVYSINILAEIDISADKLKEMINSYLDRIDAKGTFNIMSVKID